tara:strand:+ start:114 stop:335 length:222 start_codon:yes stop_codon:yes gene_type:complete
MIKTLEAIAVELKRANDLKERDIKNKETWGWYNNPSPVQTSYQVRDDVKYQTSDQVRYGAVPSGYSVTTKGRW